jgi:N-acetylneuraminic acid mutarotase
MPELPTLIRDAAASPSAPCDEHVLRRRVHQRRLRRRARRGALAVMLAGAIALVGLVLVDDDRDPVVDTGPAPRPALGPRADISGWERLPPGPADGRVNASTVWTGTEYIVWGGEAPSETTWHDTGAAYNPTTGRWRRLAPSPLAARSGHVAVWTGEEMLVCCGYAPSGPSPNAAAYRPRTDTWRSIANSPLGVVTNPAAAWTGDEMLVVGGANRGETAEDRRGAAYDPATDTWRRLSSAPGVIERSADAAWTGERLLVWPRFFTSSPGLSYDPSTDTWERLPPLPDGLRADIASMVWTGEEMLVWGVRHAVDSDATGARFDPESGRWRPLADDPLPPFRRYEGTPGSQSAVWTGTEMVVWTGALGAETTQLPDGSADAVAGTAERTAVIAYDPSADRWRELPDAPGAGYNPAFVWTGKHLIVESVPRPLISTPS